MPDGKSEPVTGAEARHLCPAKTQEPRLLTSGLHERRSRRRYPLRMPLSGRFLGRRTGKVVGETLNLSSQGLLFFAREAVPDNATIELEIEWPVRSGNGDRLRLSVFAVAVRSARNLVAARIWRAYLLPGAKPG